MKRPYQPTDFADWASIPRVRADRDTPLLWDETAADIEVIWVGSEPEYFLIQGWTLIC